MFYDSYNALNTRKKLPAIRLELSLSQSGNLLPDCCCPRRHRLFVLVQFTKGIQSILTPRTWKLHIFPVTRARERWIQRTLGISSLDDCSRSPVEKKIQTQMKGYGFSQIRAHTTEVRNWFVALQIFVKLQNQNTR